MKILNDALIALNEFVDSLRIRVMRRGWHQTARFTHNFTAETVGR